MQKLSRTKSHLGNEIVRQTLAAVKSVPAVSLHLPLPMLCRILISLRPPHHADEHANKNNEDSKERTLVLGRWDARSANINPSNPTILNYKVIEFERKIITKRT